MITKSIAVKDEKGNNLTVNIHQWLVSQASKDNPSAMREGQKEAYTDDGQQCTPHGKNNEFKIVNTGEILTPV